MTETARKRPVHAITAVRLLAAGLFLLLLALLPRSAAAQVFPFYDAHRSYVDEQHRETWAPWPFYTHTATSSTLNVAFHPLYSYYQDHATGNRDVDAVWPIFTYRYRPERNGAMDYRSYYLFPLFFDRKETRFGKVLADLIIIPIWFSGRQGDSGRYQILFPFYWYAWNARLSVPLFPPRPVTFGMLFPIAGDIRGYYNRDRISFFLWPLLVYSSEGHRSSEDFNEIYSLLWPIFGIYNGPKVSGFRVWPLFANVKKEGEYHRAYWLWPLGHYRQGRISKRNPEQEDVVLFIPFYARFRRPNISLDMVFPFYGKLKVGDRTSRGYALAIYNTDVNTRTKVREDRYFWFLIRHKTRLPGYTPEIDPEATVGGGFFPFYTRTHSESRVAKSIIWPFHTYRFNRYKDYAFTRSYVVPFYSMQRREFNDGRTVWTRFLFPFFRERTTLQNEHKSNSLHLFFYAYAGPPDRSYAPLWTFWEKSENTKTGEKTLRVCKDAWKYERRADGSERRSFHLLFVNYESTRAADGTKSGYTRFFWGLAGRHRDPELKTELFGHRF